MTDPYPLRRTPEGRSAVLCELSADYVEIIRGRLDQFEAHGSDVARVGAPTIFDGGTA